MEQHINIIIPDQTLNLMEWEHQFTINRIGQYIKPKDHHMEREGIREAVMILCLDGYGYVHYKGKEHLIQKGNFVFLEPYTPHAYGTWDDRSWSILWIHFSGNGIGGLMKLFEKHNIDHISSIPNYLFIAEELRHIIALLQDTYTAIDIHKACSMLQLLLLDYIEQYSHCSSDRRYIKKATHYMKNNLKNNIDLEDIAKHLGITTFHTIRIFKQSLMTTPMQYYQMMRVSEAGRLLLSTDLSVTEICQMLNYSSLYQFSQVFKKKMGVSPAAYRKLM